MPQTASRRKTPKQSKAQKETVGRVMHEFKHGALKRGKGGKVRNPRQAIAIALSEAGASNRQDATTNRRRLAATKRREGRARATGEGPTKAALYEEARRRGIPGRSRMDKAALRRALRRAG